jgi:hypothetical protein
MLCRYLIELCLIEYKFIKYCASKIACSAIYLANKILKKEHCWNDTISYHADY